MVDVPCVLANELIQELHILEGEKGRQIGIILVPWEAQGFNSARDRPGFLKA